MHVGSPVLALTLFGFGARRDFGHGFRKIYQDVEERWGHAFILRNDNGRLRKLTAAARTREFGLLSPKESDKREPIVAIYRFSSAQGRETPPTFFFLYGHNEVLVKLQLPLEEDSRAQSNALLEIASPWVAAFPLVGGTITPAIAHSANASWTVEDETFRQARANRPGFQFIPDPPLGGMIDGLGNWGEITLIGPKAQEALGAASTPIPECLSQHTIGSNLIVQTRDRTLALGTSFVSERAREAYSRMASYLLPAQSSVYKKHVPTAEWNRLTVDWQAGHSAA